MLKKGLKWEFGKKYGAVITAIAVCTIAFNFSLSNVSADKVQQDFTMTSNPWPLTVTAGKPASWPFAVSSTSPMQVNLSCFVPSPASCNLTQPTIFTNETINVLFKTSVNSPSQTRVVVTGTEGTISHSSIFTVNLNSNLPNPITNPPFIPTVPLTLVPPSKVFEASMVINPSYNQGDTLEESMMIQNISNQTIPAGAIYGIVSIMANGTKIFSDNFHTAYDVSPSSVIGQSGTGIIWNKSSWTIPTNLTPGWYEMDFIFITKEIQHGQIFFQILNKSSTSSATQSNPISNSTKTPVFTDKKEFVLMPNQDTSVKIFGNLANYGQQLPIKLSVENPIGVREDLSVYGTNRGDFQLTYILPKNSLTGTYRIHLGYAGLEVGNTTFDVINPQQPGTKLIPAWFKNPVLWWSDGGIDDSEFIHSVQFLLKNNLIKVQPALKPSGQSEQIPVWVKNNASLWARNQISDMSFIQAIEYLISAGIIK